MPNDRELIYEGMTLRDWFAGQALAGLTAQGAGDAPWPMLATAAYRAADAMLAIRDQLAPPRKVEDDNRHKEDGRRQGSSG